MNEPEHSQQLRTPTFEIVFAHFVHTMHHTQSETSNRTLQGHLLCDGLGAALGKGYHGHHSSRQDVTVEK